MNDQNHVIESTAAHALGALTAEEASAVEAHCAVCPDCAADLAEMNATAATLPLACETASPSSTLKRRILAAARGDVAADQFLRNQARRRVRFTAQHWAAAAAAALLAGAVVGSGAYMDHQRMASDMDQMHRQIAAGKARESVLAAQVIEGHRMLAVVAAGRVWDVTFGPPQHWWHCTIVQPPKPAMAMIVADTPSAPKGMTYQAWVIHHGKTHAAGMLPAGKMTVMDMPMPVETGDVVAFSVEPMGGSATPTMPYVMEHTL